MFILCVSDKTIFAQNQNLRPTFKEEIASATKRMKQTLPVQLSDDVKKAILNADYASAIMGIGNLEMTVTSSRPYTYYYLRVHASTVPTHPVFEGVHYGEFLVVYHVPRDSEEAPKKIKVYGVNLFDTPFQGKLHNYLTPEGIAFLAKQKALLPLPMVSPPAKKQPAKKQ